MIRYSLLTGEHMKIFKLFKSFGVIIVISLSGGVVYAGGDHSHGAGGHSHAQATTIITEAQAKEAAINVVKKLVERKKLKSGWLQIEIKTIGKKKFKSKDEWVITLENSKAEKSKQILYVFLSLSGEYLGANFTGN